MEKLIKSVQRFLDFRAEQEALLLTDSIKPKDTNVSTGNSVALTEGEAKSTNLLSAAHVGCKHAVALKLGDVVTLNLTVLQGGVTADGGKSWALNVIPMEAMAGFDIRIPPHIKLADFEKMLKSWLEPDVDIEFVVKSDVNRFVKSRVNCALRFCYCCYVSLFLSTPLFVPPSLSHNPSTYSSSLSI